MPPPSAKPPQITLRFPPSAVALSGSLSAVVMVGDDLWVGADEGVEIARLEPDGRDTYAAQETANLGDYLELPADDTEEADIEGMGWEPRDIERGYLWLVGSHSLKREAARALLKKENPSDPDERRSDEKNLRDLEKRPAADGNRFLLARLPVEIRSGRSRLIPRAEWSKEVFGAQLPCSKITSDLLDALRDDPLLGRFVAAELPGKENGLDIEGLACIEDGRLLIGLRGPMPRGMAVVLEVKVEPVFAGKGKTGGLKLKKLGPDGRLYLRHFLDLGGLAVRDLVFRGDDLLILAGPTMPMDFPATVFAWRDARPLLGGSERFAWRRWDELKIVAQGPPPGAPDHDRAEGILLLGDASLLVIYDSPSDSRRPGNSTDILGDLLAL